MQIGPFRLLEQVGEGGQGTVWKASQPGQAPMALKLMTMPPGGAQSAEVVRMRREAEALERLSHPSLVRCHGVIEDHQRGYFGLVLDWVDGQALGQAVRDAAMTQAHRMWVLGHVVRALAYLHGSGLVHRDVKLNNVLVSRAFWAQPNVGETVKLVDLGVAVPVGNPNPLTAMGNIVGTAAYVAPEVLTRGRDPRNNASPKGDVFAFGVLGWRMLTGEHPAGVVGRGELVQFVAAYQAAMAGLVAWPSRGEVEGPWGDVLCACLSLDASRRPESCEQLVAMLEGRLPVPPRPAKVSAPPPAPLEGDDDDVPTTFRPSPALMAAKARIQASSGSAPQPARPIPSPASSPIQPPASLLASSPRSTPPVMAAPPSGHASAHPPSSITSQRPPFAAVAPPHGGSPHAPMHGGPTSSGPPLSGPPPSPPIGASEPPSSPVPAPPPTLAQGQAPAAERDPTRLLVVVSVVAGLVLLSGIGVLLGIYLTRH